MTAPRFQSQTARHSHGVFSAAVGFSTGEFAAGDVAADELAGDRCAAVFGAGVTGGIDAAV